MFKTAQSRCGAIVPLLAIAASLVTPAARALSPLAVVAPAGSGITVVAVDMGSQWTCALLKGGTVKCWGDNQIGVLGLGTVSGSYAMIGNQAGEMGDYLATIDLGTGRSAKAIAAGGQHACAILDNGKVKCWGDNSSGQLGIGNIQGTRGRIGNQPGEMGNNLAYVNLGTGRKAKAIAAGNTHTCAMLDNGAVKCWGYNAYGQLGIGDSVDRGDSTSPGHLMGNALPTVNLGTGRKAKAITAGNWHTCALLDNNTVKCWGNNSSGQLGLGDSVNRGDSSDPGHLMGNALPAVNLGTGRKAKTITAGWKHTCALLDNNTVKCWGNNSSGQLGLGDSVNRGDSSDPGHLMGNALPAVNLGTGRKAKAVSAGAEHTCALLDNGDLKCWGYNEDGNLGEGDVTNKGDDLNEMGDALLPIALGGGLKIRAVATGGSYHTCAIFDPGILKCWGYNSNGQLGIGDSVNRGDSTSPGHLMGDDLPAINLGVRVRSLSVYSYHACAVLENRSLQCWGDNTHGQLGYGDNSHRGDNPVEMGNNLTDVDLGTGRSVRSLGKGPADLFTCAVLDNGQVKCWGTGNVGRIGSGNEEILGDNVAEMGDNLIAVDLGEGRTARSVALGGQHACAILDNSTVKCWGRNDSGQLGIGDTVNRGDSNVPGHLLGGYLPTVQLGTARKAKALAAGFEHTCALLDNGTVKCWGNGRFGQLGNGKTALIGDGDAEMGNNLAPIDLGRKAIAISAGAYHTCALLDNGTVKCWGNNISGQLGLGDSFNRGDDEDEMGANLDSVDLGTGAKAKAIAAGYYQTCVILVGGAVKCWGSNAEGALGYGDTQDRGSGPDQMGNYLPTVSLGGSHRAIAVSVGDAACALLDDYSVRCWGYNDEGQLGQGDTIRRGDDPGEMGNNLRPVPLTG